LGQLHSLQRADEYTYPDLLAMFICIIMVVIVVVERINSMMLNNVLDAVNMVLWVSRHIFRQELFRQKNVRKGLDINAL